MKLKFWIFSITTVAVSSCVGGHKDYFRNFPEGKTPAEIGVRLTEKFLVTDHTYYGNIESPNEPTLITYPDVCTWLGGLWFAKETSNDELFARLQERFEPLFDEEKHLQPPANHVDHNVFGALPLEFYLKTKNKRYLDLGLMYADTQWDLPDTVKDPQIINWVKQGYSRQTRVWLDDMFMITNVQAQAYKATGDLKYLNRSAKEMVLYLDEIQLENGLFYHAPSAPFSWGRGNGWMAVGITEVMRNIPEENPHRAIILEGYQKMMAALLEHQAEDGMWRQLIDDPESWKETSSSAMFTYAFITGVQQGWLDEDTYGPAARKAWLSLVDYINEEDNVTDVCEGTNISNSRQFYLNRKRITGDLHGQAPLLWCAMALVRE